MSDSIVAGVGDEVLVTVCCGAVISFLVGLYYIKWGVSHSDAELRQEFTRPPHTYNNELCPICLGPPRLAVETNCGHKFCGICIKNFLSNRAPRGFSLFSGRLSCPMCRQDINILLLSFELEETTSSDLSTERTEIETTVYEYNVTFGNSNRPLWSYIRDCPVLVRHLFNDFFSSGGLMWMFRLRVMACFLAAFLYLFFPVDLVPESVFGFFGFVDDLLVFFLCVIYASILYRSYILSRDPNLLGNDE